MSRHEYFRPSTLEQAFALATSISDARFVAGGTDWFVKTRRSGARPLISLRGISGLDAIEWGDQLRVGATCLVADVLERPAIRREYPALVEAARALGSVQIRNMATVGGNLCNASPAADLAVPLLAYQASLEIAGPGGSHHVELADFFVGPGHTILKKNEILRAVLLPRQGSTSRSLFLRRGRVKMDLACVSLAVCARLEAERFLDLRVAAGAVAPIPLRLHAVEELLESRKLDAALLEQAVELARESISPISDLRSTAAYRRHLTGVFLERALAGLGSMEEGREPISVLSGPPHPDPLSPQEMKKPAPSPPDGEGVAARGKLLRFTLNGSPASVWALPQQRLLDILRGPLGQTGSKEGCGEGECGACTVLVDGRAINACLFPAIEAEAMEVLTVEGLLDENCRLSPLQQAFVDCGGIQCGFCTPGMLLASKALLDKNPDPSPEAIVEALTGNLCRCTGYKQIVASVQEATRRLRGVANPEAQSDG